jgi:predicted DNA-binding transcriptional regulator YafY
MSKENLSVVAQFFTDDEWSAIESALRDYQDYGDEESDIAENIQSKIYKLFKD